MLNPTVQTPISALQLLLETGGSAKPKEKLGYIPVSPRRTDLPARRRYCRSVTIDAETLTAQVTRWLKGG